MRLGTLVIIGSAVGAAAGRAIGAPFPGAGENPYLDLIAYHDPGIHTAIRIWYHAAPAAAVVLAGNLCLAVWRVWFQPLVRIVRRGRLPKWPASPGDDKPSLVVGELHHPTVPRPSERPSWLVIPEKGLYTGVLVVGAVGTGKTSACMYPFARQLLHWRADDPKRRAGALVLEVKGDFCHQVRSILDEAGRGDDYLEIGLGGSWQWNPLDDPLLDSYSLAYGVASLINQLFGKSREPFWQQAYTNLVRWIIELHRLLPGGWVTLRDVYRCTVDAELFADKIGEAKATADRVCPQRAVIANADLAEHKEALGGWAWKPVPGTASAAYRVDGVSATCAAGGDTRIGNVAAIPITPMTRGNRIDALRPRRPPVSALQTAGLRRRLLRRVLRVGGVLGGDPVRQPPGQRARPESLANQRRRDARAHQLLGVGVVGDDIAVGGQAGGVDRVRVHAHRPGQGHGAVLVRILEPDVQDDGRVRRVLLEAGLQGFLRDPRHGHAAVRSSVLSVEGQRDLTPVAPSTPGRRRRRSQFIEQAPAPRGSPQVPQAPGAKLAAAGAARPTANADRRFSRVEVSQVGHGGAGPVRTSNSKSCRHREHWYS